MRRGKGSGKGVKEIAEWKITAACASSKDGALFIIDGKRRGLFAADISRRAFTDSKPKGNQKQSIQGCFWFLQHICSFLNMGGIEGYEHCP